MTESRKVVRPWHIVVECPMKHKLTATLEQIRRHDSGESRMTCPFCDSEVQRARKELEVELAMQEEPSE